jgi:hypothetical protein
MLNKVKSLLVLFSSHSFRLLFLLVAGIVVENIIIWFEVHEFGLLNRSALPFDYSGLVDRFRAGILLLRCE